MVFCIGLGTVKVMFPTDDDTPVAFAARMKAAVADGRAKTVNAVASMAVSTLVQRGQEGGITVRFVPSNLTAPVRAGQQVGVAVVSQGGQQIGKVPAVAQTAVDKQSWWKKFWPF